MHTRPAQRGITLIETAIVVAVLAITLGTALPSFAAFIEHVRLGGVAARVATDLQSARLEAVARNAIVHLAFGEDEAGSCYVLYTGASGDCSCSAAGPASCKAGGDPIKAVWLPADDGIVVRPKVKAMLTNPLHGTSTPANTVHVLDRHGHEIHHVVNMMGRIKSCSPGASVRGYAAC